MIEQDITQGYTLIPNKPDKGTFIGEFEMSVTHHCSACGFHGAQDDCEVCGGEVEYTQKHTIPWTLFKEMYAAIISAAPSAPIEAQQSEPINEVAAFEKWLSENTLCRANLNIELEYADPLVEMAYKGWKARKALILSTQAPKEVE